MATLPGSYSLYPQLSKASQNQPKQSRMNKFFQSPYVTYGMPIAGFGAGIWGDAWVKKLLNKGFRRGRHIRMDRLTKDTEYITKRTGEEFATRGTAGSTLHNEVLAHRLLPIQEETQYIQEAHRARRRSMLYDILFGG
jgi:hypothetical protein